MSEVEEQHPYIPVESYLSPKIILIVRGIGKTMVVCGMGLVAAVGSWTIIENSVDSLIPAETLQPSELQQAIARVNSSRYGPSLVNVVSGAEARGTVVNSRGESIAATIRNPIWYRVNSHDFMIGLDDESESGELLAGQLGDGMILCGINPESPPVRWQMKLGNNGSDGFQSVGIGVAKPGEIIAEACEAPFDINTFTRSQPAR